MILRRFTEHVKNENWFAVSLDVCVVIVGIFIGMQVTQWNQSRLDRITEREFLVRLHEDFVENIEALQLRLEIYNSLVASHESVIKILNNDDLGAEDEQFLMSNLPRFGLWLAFDIKLATIDELVSSGDMNIIRDPSIRESLLEFRANQALLNEQLDYYRQWYLTHEPKILVGWNLTIVDSAVNQRDAHTRDMVAINQLMNLFSGTIDVDQIRSPESIKSVAIITMLRHLMRSFIADHLERARQTEELLAPTVEG
jgi:hypothetical protein